MNSNFVRSHYVQKNGIKMVRLKMDALQKIFRILESIPNT
ncbi:Hypothetical protein I595_3396 [Croceitalea dokdonensis DOKDO 023]|uniref:Uncharacterized protein n=1 Tax=Croceitalea dokdonensis DOKDO 023 TaxID=1300341 RepID=A0A0P7ARY0_9FLAO|nr:Hypothetical protein I595_3396 [Croceitalea dokdonensis DOKDO 023]